MEVLDIILCFLAMTTMTSVMCGRSAVKMIPKIGRNFRYFPVHYVTPNKWFKKVFKIKQHKIPRFLYSEMKLSVFCALLGPLYSAIYLYCGGKKECAGMLILVHASIVVIDTLYFAVMVFRYKHRPPKTSKRTADNLREP